MTKEARSPNDEKAHPFVILSFIIPSSFGIRISSFSHWRANSHAFTFELCSQFMGELNCARRVAMNADCFAPYIHIATFDGTHFAFAQHPQHALSSHFWIAKQGVRSRPRHEPTVIQVITIGKNFAGDS